MTINILTTSLDRYSPLLTDDNGNLYFGIRERIDTRERPDDALHVVHAWDRIDALAHQYLGDPNLWRIIAEYNDIMFGLVLPPEGSVLRIPSRRAVQMEILP